MAEIDRRNEAVEPQGRAAVSGTSGNPSPVGNARSSHQRSPTSQRRQPRPADGVFEGSGPKPTIQASSSPMNRRRYSVARAAKPNHGAQFRNSKERGNGAKTNRQNLNENIIPGPALLRGSSRQHDMPVPIIAPNAQHGQSGSA